MLYTSQFRIDNTDHIIDVNRGNAAFEYDQINIICPMYTKGTREDDIETDTKLRVQIPFFSDDLDEQILHAGNYYIALS
ncbi:Ephrin-B2a [Dermatophagoides farinae]|uniref:Ephrin-B2a n=1 Tax=Dermatophagoides farinae TaxID=6954 RepID=A0A922L327_DERFA|nr:Ephrin-B2a [Dermatophagoides farinae]